MSFRPESRCARLPAARTTVGLFSVHPVFIVRSLRYLLCRRGMLVYLKIPVARACPCRSKGFSWFVVAGQLGPAMLVYSELRLVYDLVS